MRTVTLTPLLVTGSVYESLTSVVFWALFGIGFCVAKLEVLTLPARRAAAPVLEGNATSSRPGSLIEEGAR